MRNICRIKNLLKIQYLYLLVILLFLILKQCQLILIKEILIILYKNHIKKLLIVKYLNQKYYLHEILLNH